MLSGRRCSLALWHPQGGAELLLRFRQLRLACVDRDVRRCSPKAQRVRRISLLRFALLRLLDSTFPGNPLQASWLSRNIYTQS